MLNAAQLRDRLAVDFPDAAQISDTVVSFMRRADSRPYAVVYVDVSTNLPNTQDALTKYQDEIIGRRYFDGPKSLQWSNYLYFLTTARRLVAKDAQRAKELIEADRSYARKFVLPEDELDTILSPPIVTPTNVGKPANVLGVWLQILVASGLDYVILRDADLPRRVKSIEESSSDRRILLPDDLSQSVDLKSPSFIQSLRLAKYRQFPRRRNFEFGSANLIVGPNAAGKTSLLEAIELLFCGRNKRSPDKTPQYELHAVFSDGRSEKAVNGRKPRIYRNRNLVWYGRPEVKTNTLYQSFAQFNFLDTDAAVDISESTANIEDDLSKLLVGPDASKTWRTIVRVSAALSARGQELRKLLKQVDEERDSLLARIKADAEIEKQSGLLATRANKALARLGWSILPADNQQPAASELSSSLSELTSFAEQASSLGWIPAPVTRSGLANYLSESKNAIRQAEPAVSLLQTQESDQRKLNGAARQISESLARVEQLKRMIAARVPQRAADHESLLNEVARIATLLVGTETVSPISASLAVSNSLAACVQQAEAKKLEAERNLQHVRDENSKFEALRGHSLNLALQLRQIAGEILKGSHAPDECPLCHTEFPPGELAQHIVSGINPHTEAVGQVLQSRIRKLEIEFRAAQGAEVVYRRLSEFAKRRALPSNVPVSLALEHLAEARQELATVTDRLHIVEKEIEELESRGLTFAQYEEISRQLADIERPLAQPTAEAAAELSERLTRDAAQIQSSIEEKKAQINQCEVTLRAALPYSPAGLAGFKVTLSEIKERLATTDSVSRGLNAQSELFPWSALTPLAELVVSAKPVGALLADLQTALERERRSGELQVESSRRLKHLDEQRKELRPRLTRVNSAHKTLTGLMKQNSLNAAMETAIAKNRLAIESIFSRIHSPTEFSGLGSRFDRLVRKSDSDEASLAEISTGQRAAFALSIFLAHNSQLTEAPPVILIDDPIAHVDDLNSLSFLDYLREVAIEGKRQIFFATANDKIAALFERKFDFLGKEGFRKIEISREST